jgi:hypothetical protein
MKILVEPAAQLPKLTAAVSPPLLKQQLRRLRLQAAPELDARLRQERKDAKAEQKKQVAQAAAKVAREAAREARLVEAARRHDEEDRARTQLRRAQKAQRAVTGQLRALQAAARAFHTSHGSDRSQGQQSADETSHLDAQSDSGDSSSQGARSEQGGVPEGLDSGHEHTSVTHSCDAASESSETAAHEQNEHSRNASPDGEHAEGSADNEHGSAAPAGHADDSVQGAATANQSEANTSPELGAPQGATQHGNEQGVPSVGAETANEGGMSSTVESTAASAEAGTRPTAAEAQALVVVDPQSVDSSALIVTGKRASPPSPSSSDDESHRRAKWAQGVQSPPFSVDISPITGADVELLPLPAAAAKSKAPRSGSRQVPIHETRTHGTQAADDHQQPKRRQRALSEFYGPESLAEAQERLDREIAARHSHAPTRWAENFPSPELDVKLLDLRSPRDMEAWKSALGARVIEVPGNGGCLYYALYCCRTGWKMRGASIKGASTHSVEANHYKAGVCKEYLAYLDQMLSDGTITIADLNQRYFNTKQDGFEPRTRRKVLAAIRQFIQDIAGANLGGKGLSESQ